MTIRQLLSAVIIILSALPCFAESFVSLEGYPEHVKEMRDYTNNEQLLPIPLKPNGPVLYPVFGYPALVTEKDPYFSVIIHSEKELKSGSVDIYKKVIELPRTVLKLKSMTAESIGNHIYRFTFFAPVILPNGVYNLKFESEGVDGSTDNSIGFRRADDFSFYIFTDPQIEDLQSKRTDGMDFNAKQYPGYSKSLLDYSRQYGIIKNSMSQMNLSNSDFVTILGDLVFGINYQAEYADIMSLLTNLEIPAFAVPGNHDGYAKYSSEKDFTSPLEYDGLYYWRDYLGPAYFSFKTGGRLFMMLNTYDGTAERRASGVAIGIGDNAAVPVSNFGGFLSDEQGGWARKILETTDVFGVFSHQLPIGAVDAGFKFEAQEKYPTNSIIGAVNEEEWNYESAAYDSNTLDSISNETAFNNTGTKLVFSMTARTPAPYYFAGHAHFDRTYVYKKGTEIIPKSGFTATSDMTFIQTTTPSSNGESFFGIRKIYWDKDGIKYNYLCKEGLQCNPGKTGDENGFQSIPLGNIWVKYKWGVSDSLYRGGEGISNSVSAEINNSLPTDENVKLRFIMPAEPGGFVVDNPDFAITDAMISLDRKTMFVTVEGKALKGTEPEQFYQKAFTQKTASVSITTAKDKAIVPETSFTKTIYDGDPTDFSVTNNSEFLRLIWMVKDEILADGKAFGGLNSLKLGNNRVDLLYIDKKGSWGIESYYVNVEVKPEEPDIEAADDDDMLAQEDNAVNTDTADISAVLDENSDADAPGKSPAGCGCTVIY